jgi:predicted ArsR family transcriptional regulator
MKPDELTEDLFALMAIIKENGGTDCTGTCHHRKSGEFHCHTVGRALKISSQGVKNRILDLFRSGFLDRERIDREGSTRMVKYTVSAQGEEALGPYLKRLEEKEPA